MRVKGLIFAVIYIIAWATPLNRQALFFLWLLNVKTADYVMTTQKRNPDLICLLIAMDAENTLNTFLKATL